MISFYPILHFLIDGICAFAMCGTFLRMDNALMSVLNYNLCAFALQMPIGVIVDMLPGRRKYDKEKHAMYVAGIGTALTVIGSFIHPALMGLGNAIFHVGGGCAAIHGDRFGNKKGLCVALFVAPGALGVFAGSSLSSSADSGLLILVFRILAVFLCLGLFYIWFYHDEERRVQTKLKLFDPIQIRKPGDSAPAPASAEKITTGGMVLAAALCGLVVMLRSYVGVVHSFSWNTTLVIGLVSVLCVCFGKVLGGVIGAKVGFLPAAILSLAGAGIFFLFSDYMVCGLLGQLLFNMTMPITLTILVRKMQGKEAFAFGFLSFAIFLGIIPQLLGWQIPVSSHIVASVSAFLSLLLLLPLLLPGKRSAEK